MINFSDRSLQQVLRKTKCVPETGIKRVAEVATVIQLKLKEIAGWFLCS